MTSDPDDLAELHPLRRRRADAGRREQRPGSHARRARERDGRARALGQGVDRRLRVDRLPRRHRGRVRPDPRARQRAPARGRLQARLLARAHQPGRQGAHAREDHQGRQRRGRGDARARRRRLRRDRRRRGAPGPEHQGRRGRQGHREHAARPQHRADERARDHLRPDGDPHRGRARRGRHEVELPEVHARGWSAATASASTRTT